MNFASCVARSLARFRTIAAWSMMLSASGRGAVSPRREGEADAPGEADVAGEGDVAIEEAEPGMTVAGPDSLLVILRRYYE
jgi:hypothetical protein